MPILDKKGREVKEWDLVKIFHFIGARRKKHFMYKLIRKDPKTGRLIGDSLSECGHNFSFHEIYEGQFEIIQRGAKGSWEDL